ncbi:MAG: discoidin domain-containing protein [Phycisphaeraceae bacterium]
MMNQLFRCALAALAVGALAMTTDADTPAAYDIDAAREVEVVDAEAGLDLDAWGGTRSIRGEATGWFDIQAIDGRSWLVTPEGNAMVSIGITHIFHGRRQPIFQQAYGGNVQAYYTDVAENIRRWGFNTVGYGGGGDLPSGRPEGEPMPTVVDMGHLLGISRFSPQPERIDLFTDEARQLLAERIAERVEPVKDATNLIGYFYVDLPLWLPARRRGQGQDWGIAYRPLDADAPGKAVYIDFLIGRHGSAEAVGEAYGLEASTHDELLAETAWAGVEDDDATVEADDRAFVPVVAAQYYKVVHEEIRRLDPNHLIFGDRYMGADLRELDPVLEAAAPYVDAIAIQPFDRGDFDRDRYDHIHELTGKPIIFCDMAVNHSTPEWPEGLWRTLSTPEEAAEVWARYLADAFDRPYMIGVHRCTYIDRPRGEQLKQGFVRQDGTPYERTIQRYTEIHRELYRRMYGGPDAAATGQLVTGVAVQASHWEQEAHGGWGDFPAENAVDGDRSPGSSWRGEGEGVWFQFDLGESASVRGVALAVLQGDARQYSFDVMVSDSGEAGSWRTVLEGAQTSGETLEMERFRFDAGRARFVRLVGRGNTSEQFPHWFNITEAAVVVE